MAVEEIGHDHTANRRDDRAEQDQEGNQHLVHAANGQQRADGRADQGHGLALAGAQQVAAGCSEVVDGVVLGGPQVEEQHDHGSHGQALQHQHFDHVRLLVDDGAIGTGDDHQAIADEEAEQAGQHRDAAALGEARPVGGLGGAADEGAEDQGDGHAQAHALGRFHRQQASEAADITGGDPQRSHQQHQHGRHGDAREQIQALVADEGGETETEAEQHHQRDGQAFGQAENLHQDDGDGRRAPGVPADLGEAKKHVGQLAAHLAEAETAHQYRVQPTAAGDQTQYGSIQTE